MVSAREISSIVRDAKCDWRRAESRDAPILLQWRNDPVSVMYSKSRAPVLPEQHASWLSTVLREESTELLIGESFGVPIATCRFESGKLTPGAFLVSINVAPAHRGHGAGQELLASAISHFLARHDADLLAEIHKDNIASERIFTKVGFRWVASDCDFNCFLLQATPKDAA